MSMYEIRRAGGRTKGPFTASEVRELVANGQLLPTDEVSRVGENSWMAAGQIKALFPKGAPRGAEPPSVDPAEPGRMAEIPGNLSDPGVPAWAAESLDRLPPPLPERDASARPASPSAHASVANSVPSGPIDRFFRMAFGFGRFVSVLVLIVAALMIGGGAAVAGWTMLPTAMGFGSDSIDPPAIEGFITACSGGGDAQGGSDEPVRRSGSRGSGSAVDPCADHREQIRTALKNLRLESAGFESMLCGIALQLPESDRADWVDGLADYAAEFPAYVERGYRCEAEQALTWYNQQFQLRMLERAQAEEANRAIAAGRAQIRLMAIGGIGTGIAAILGFLVLPLLIQIERNTRAVSA